MNIASHFSQQQELLPESVFTKYLKELMILFETNKLVPKDYDIVFTRDCPAGIEKFK